MGKVIKNVVKTVVAALCGVLLAALVLPLAVSLLLSVPAFRDSFVDRAARELSERLGTRISIDYIGLKRINSVEIRGFYVEDFGGDTLLYVPRLEAPVMELGLVGEPFTLGRVRLSGAQLRLHKERAEDDMNISRVVDAMRSRRMPKNPDSRFRMNILGIEADSLTFVLERGDRALRAEGVDFSRFKLGDIHARIDDFSIRGDSIRMQINSLGGVERSGLVIDRLAAHPLVVSRGSVVLDEVSLSARGSELRLPSIRLVSGDRDWSDFGEFTDSVAMEITMRPSRVTTDLVGAFVPSVAGWGIILDDVALSTRGPVEAMTGTIESARTRATTFALDFTSRGLPHFSEARIDANLRSFDTSGGDITAILHSITDRELPPGVTAMLDRVGPIGLTGRFEGMLRDFAASGHLVTGLGAADPAARVRIDEQATSLDAVLSTAGLDLGRLFDVEELGAVSGVFAANGSVAPGDIRGEIRGEVGALAYRGYNYTDLTFDVTAEGRRYFAGIVARDPALTADLAASFLPAAGDSEPRYTLDLDLARADLAAARLNRSDSISLLSGRLKTDLTGRGPDAMNGTISLTDARYRSPGGEVTTTRPATIEARSDASGKYIALRSEFADGEVRSRTGYRDMFAYLGTFLQKYIPLRSFGEASEALVPPDGGDPAALSNYSIVSLNVKNTEPLLAALLPAAAISEGSNARFMFNPYTGSFSLSARSQFIEYGGMLAANLEATADNAADSLTVYLSGTDIYTGRGHISRFALHGGAKKRLGIDVSLDSGLWRVTADSINAGGESGRIDIANLNIFSADNPDQRLVASGVVSRSTADTLRLQLNSFDLSLPARLVRLGRLSPSGLATGRLDIASVLTGPRINAGLAIRDLVVGGLQAPPLRFESRPTDGGGVGLRLVDESVAADVLRGELLPGGVISAQIAIDSLDGALLDPLLGGVLENTRGRASVRLTLGGTLRKPIFNGTLDVPAFETTVGYTRAAYSVKGAHLTVENSVLRLPRTSVANRIGGTGDLAMTVDLSDFRNIGVDIEARADNLLAFDTGPGDSEMFYGRVFATGTVGIRSGRMGTRIDISARTDAGTRFHLPLNAKSNVSWADFVVFADRRTTLDTTNVLERKKQIYERRLAGDAGSRRAKPLELNLTTSVTSAAEVHMLIDPNLGQGITGRGEGVIDMRINPASDLFTMTGDYNISSGRFEFSMMDVFNKTFEIGPGSTLRWSGAADDVLLSVDASYRLRTSLLPLVGTGSPLSSSRAVPVDCIIRLRESLSDPEITFDISLPSADADARQIVANAMNTQELKSMQFLSLLTTGSFATDNSITGQAANAGVTATGAVGFDILTNQLNNFLSSDDYDVYFRYRPQDSFVGTQVEAGFSTGFLDNRLQLEIEGNYVDNRAATSVGMANTSNLAGDVSLTWVIDRAGNLRLKVFSQTIDRLNETQGLQESGLGIYYKKDFDSMRDVFRRSVSRTGNNYITFAQDSVIVNTRKQRRINNQKK